MADSLALHLPTPEATFATGQRLGRILRPGDLLGLDGPLGAGKTQLVQGLARGLDVPPSVPVGSPTFTLINEHAGRLPLYHVDLYRILREEELDELGLWELAESDGVMAVEWLSRFPHVLPRDHLQLDLSIVGSGRALRLLAPGPRAQETLDAFVKEIA